MSEPGGQDFTEASNEAVARTEPEAIRRNRRERITLQLMRSMKPVGHRTVQDQSHREIMDDLMRPVPLPEKPDPELRYSAFSPGSGINLAETLHGVIVTPPGFDTRLSDKPLLTEIQERLHLNEEQRRNHLTGITGAQIEEMSDMVERSGLPLAFSATDEELLYELSLASGRTVTDLDAVTLAEFSFPAEKYRGRRENRLIDLPVEDNGRFHYPSVDREKGRDRTRPDTDSYYLTYNSINYARDAEDAIAKFEQYKGYIDPNR